jgi:hypothetical protein
MRVRIISRSRRLKSKLPESSVKKTAATTPTSVFIEFRIDWVLYNSRASCGYNSIGTRVYFLFEEIGLGQDN